MKRAFVDSSVLFAAVYSASGNARDLVLMAAREEVILVISELVEEETRRNLANSTPDAVAFLVMLEQAIPFEYVNATRQEVIEAAQHVALRDAPIVAAARKAKVDFLVTYDQKHLLGKPDLARFVGAKILTPGEAIASLT